MSAWWLLPVLGGACLPLQAGINGQLARHLDSALGAAWLSFLVGTAALTGLLLGRRDLPSWADISQLPPWQLAGGLLGVVFIASAAASASRLDALLLMSLVLAGQMLAAITLDHLGLAGYTQQVVTWPRMAGLALVVCGVALVRLG